MQPGDTATILFDDSGVEATVTAHRGGHLSLAVDSGDGGVRAVIHLSAPDAAKLAGLLADCLAGGGGEDEGDEGD